MSIFKIYRIQPYHFKANRIWRDVPFKTLNQKGKSKDRRDKKINIPENTQNNILKRSKKQTT